MKERKETKLVAKQNKPANGPCTAPSTSPKTRR